MAAAAKTRHYCQAMTHRAVSLYKACKQNTKHCCSLSMVIYFTLYK